MSRAPMRSPFIRFAFLVLLTIVSTPGLKPIAHDVAKGFYRF